jgi:hypothetical protein
VVGMTTIQQSLDRYLSGLIEVTRRALPKILLAPPNYWYLKWQAQCESLDEFDKKQEKRAEQLQCMHAPGGRSGNALRVEVQDGDEPPDVPNSWRAEVEGPYEQNATGPIRYRWSTFFDEDYPRNAVTGDPDHPMFQVFFQWHQADADVGGSPPVAFIVAPGPDQQGALYLDLNAHDPHDE